MKVLLSWLRELVDCELGAEEIARGLTMQGTEAEGFTLLSNLLPADFEPALVTASSWDEESQSGRVTAKVAGVVREFTTTARNMPVGAWVLSVTRSGLSYIPTLSELGINSLKVPLVIPSNMGADGVRADAIIEFETLSNRGDLLSHLGLAREVAILTGSPWREPEVFRGAGATDEKIAMLITLSALDLCPRYAGMSFSDVQIGDSPDWLYYRLSLLGINPISNVVDLTNYVLMELGQPLHAFDPRRLDGGIIVRRAGPGEKFTAINHVEYALTRDNLVIADEGKAVAIGGVMGGVESEISDDTTELFLESAYFTPVNIRKSSKRLGLMSDSALRFGRGVDPDGTARGAERFAYLLHKIGAGRFIPGSFRDADSRRDEAKAITIPVARFEGFLGIKVTDAKIVSLLESAGFNVAGKRPAISVTAPSWRRDFAIPEDVIEEVLRLYSYTKVEPSMPALPLAAGRFEDTFLW